MIMGMKMEVSESTVNGKLHHLLKLTYSSEFSFNLRPDVHFVNSIRSCCVWYENTCIHTHRVMMIMVSTSLGEAYSVTVGAISDLIMLGLAFLTVLIKTLKQTRNAYQAGKEEPSGVGVCVCADVCAPQE